MLTIKRATGSNFMSYHNIDIDLVTFTGLTLIEGSRGSGRSNGSGKSVILELILWTMFGRTARRMVSVERVMRRGMDPKESTTGTLVLDLDGRELVVERTRGPQGPTFRVAGLSGSATNAGVQALFERTIDYDYHRFTSSVMFTGQMSSFCRLPDSARKELLERMVGVDSYHAVEDLAKTRAKTANDQLNSLRITLSGDERALEAARDRLQRARTARLLSLPRVLVERKRLKAVAVSALRSTNDAHRRYGEWVAAAAALAQERADAVATLLLARDYAHVAMDAAAESMAQHSPVVAVARAKANEIRTRIEDVEDGTHPDICATCGQRWPHDQSKHDLTVRIEAQRKQLQEAEAELALLLPKATALESVWKSARAAYRAASDAYDAAHRTAVSTGSASRDQLARVLESEHGLRRCQADLVALESSYDPDETDTELDDAREALEVVQTAHLTTQTKVEAVMVEARRLAYWQRGFGKSGLPSFLVDSAIPAMNEVVGEVASALTDGELAISFDPAAAKGKGDVFAVRVDYADGGADYDSTSCGEQTRVDVSVLFALRDLSARRSRHPCTQLFLDEVMDGTDQAFSESFMRMLRSRYKDIAVFLISHDDSIKSLCDGALLVRKQGAVSTVS